MIIQWVSWIMLLLTYELNLERFEKCRLLVLSECRQYFKFFIFSIFGEFFSEFTLNSFNLDFSKVSRLTQGGYASHLII